MSVYLHKFATQAECDAYTESENYVEPFTALIAENSGKVVYNVTSGAPVPPPVDYRSMPLTIEVVSGSGSFRIASVGETDDTLYVSVNNGEWTQVSEYTQQVSEGDILQFKGIDQNSSHAYQSDVGNIIMETNSNNLRYVVYGNIMSILRDTGFENMDTLPNDACLKNYFGDFNDYGCACPGLVSAENLILPATALTPECYNYMFSQCTLLEKAPALPATILDDRCTSLTTAPELPATTLASGCYGGMFGNCSSLNYIKCLATDISAEDCTFMWVSGISSSGTFVKDANMNDWTTGGNGIPTNWTVEDEGDPIR